MSKLPRLVEVQKLPAWVRIVRDLSYPRVISRTPMTSPKTVAQFLFDFLKLEEVEVFLLLCLDTHYKIISACEVSRGLIDTTTVDPRSTFRLAIAHNAAWIITAHNHPSGEVTPSTADRMVWRQLETAGRLLGIPVADHLVIGSEPFTGEMRYTSASEAGLMYE